MNKKIKRSHKLLLIFLSIGILILANLFLNPYLRPYLYLLDKGVIVFHTNYSGEYGGMSLYRWGILTPLTPPDYYTSESVTKWSPDGGKIAFTYWRKREGDDTYFAVLDVKTHKMTPVAYVDGNDGLSYQYPGEPYVVQFAWSPDGNRVLYSVPVSKDRQELRLFDIQTGKSKSTSIFLDSMQSDEKVVLDDLAWDPGATPLASIRYDDINPSVREEFKLFSIDSNFTQLAYVIDGAEAEWLSDGKTMIYWCLIGEGGNTCTYSFKTDEQYVHEIGLPYWQSSPDGLFVFVRAGGGEGDKPFLVVYNGLLHKVQYMSPAFSDLFGYFLLR